MRNILLLVIVAAIFCCGCGKKIVTVTGEVLFEGEPAKDIAVLFEPKSEAKIVPESGIAITNSEGRFTLESSSQKRGIEPGSYTVYMNWRNPTSVDDGGAGPAESGAPPLTSPYRFPAERQSIVLEVKGSGKNHFVFKVTPEEIRWE